MKKILEAILCGILWITDFDNILIWFLIPGGLIALGVMLEVGWLYYVLALGGYAAICRGVSWLIDRVVDKGNERIDKWLKNRKK
jgi:hypothetical protein